MSNACVLHLTQYVVRKMEFTLNPQYDFKGQKAVKLNPQFQKDIVPIDKDQVRVLLGVKVAETTQPLPFHLEVSVSGEFRIEDWFENPDKKLIVENSTIAILFPYLRSLVSMLTMNANIPPYQLPVMNIVELFKNQETKKDE